MRQLKAQRVDPDGTVVLADPETGDEFALVVDDALHAVLSDDEPAPEPPPTPGVMLSPREIQAKVRGGATVEELSELTGERVEKIMRFAHPVLLERVRAAELARASRPTGVDGPSSSTLGELVAECLTLRGDSTADSEWDAWRPEDGRWVVQLAWASDDDVEYAHWRFTPGAHGGVSEALDDRAVELTEPELAREARRAAQATAKATPPQHEVLDDGHEQVTVDADELTRRQRGPAALDLEYDRDTPPAQEQQTSQGPRHRSGRRGSPTVPAWEDVLLGVRSHPGD